MSNITCDKEMVNEMKLHMLMLMNAWMMLVLMKCKCQMQCLTLGCYSHPIRLSLDSAVSYRPSPPCDVVLSTQGCAGMACALM